MYGNDILLVVCINNDEGSEWIEGEGLFPLYVEIKSKDYSFLDLVSALNEKFSGSGKRFNSITKDMTLLSTAQQAFLSCIAID